MLQYLQMNAAHYAALPCGKCGLPTRINLSGHMEAVGSFDIKCTCPCGHSFNVHLERRKFERRKVDFYGTFTQLKEGRAVNNILVKVKDMSHAGIKLQLMALPQDNLHVGDRGVIRFYMDSPTGKLHVVRDIIIKYANGPYVGTVFVKNDPLDEHTGYFACRVEN